MKELICIKCPKGCHLHVDDENGYAVTGNSCERGAEYGKKELTKLTIKPDVIDPEDAEMLQDLVISAVNEALRQADDAMNNSMSSLTGGLNIPGLGL